MSDESYESAAFDDLKKIKVEFDRTMQMNGIAVKPLSPLRTRLWQSLGTGWEYDSESKSGWFRIFNRGLHWRDIRFSQPLHSTRMSSRSLQIGRFCVRYLPRPIRAVLKPATGEVLDDFGDLYGLKRSQIEKQFLWWKWTTPEPDKIYRKRIEDSIHRIGTNFVNKETI